MFEVSVVYMNEMSVNPLAVGGLFTDRWCAKTSLDPSLIGPNHLCKGNSFELDFQMPTYIYNQGTLESLYYDVSFYNFNPLPTYTTSLSILLLSFYVVFYECSLWNILFVTKYAKIILYNPF